MNFRRFASVSILGALATYGAACSGKVTIGNLPGDGGSSGSSSSSSSSGSNPGACGDSSATASMVFDAAAQSFAINLADFAGDGQYLYIAGNAIANFQAGRVIRVGDGATKEFYNESPASLTSIAVASSRLAYMLTGLDGEVQNVKAGPRDGGTAAVLQAYPSAIAASPTEADILVGGSGGIQSAVLRWAPGAEKGETVMSFGSSFRILHVALSSAAAVAVVRNEAVATPQTPFQVVRAPRLAGGGPYEVLGTQAGVPSSSVAVDATDAYVVAESGNRGEPNPLLRASLTPGAGSEGTFATVARVGEVGESFRRVQVDETYVYVEHAKLATCGGSSPCPASITISRVAKGTGKVEDLKRVAGIELIASSAPRGQFAVDACYLYWLDGQKIYRQPKASLASL